ncbi:hypothetical protein M5D96_013899 [Drosophila gunungcola]|uniref:ATPase dynein-related AAA domain-containing protein n=1 Tax=Drosophila gunungcola TaxID=103775 RepID=A0A9P9YAK3_9MUSC|nr:hypothetical protein M5D96_013899 [Drosophila gunungcola]
MLANLQGRSGHLLRHGLQNARIWRRSWASSSAGKDSKDSPSAEHDSLTIGDVSVRLSRPKDPQLVPQQYAVAVGAAPPALDAAEDALRQDMFLLARGPLRRQLAAAVPGADAARGGVRGAQQGHRERPQAATRDPDKAAVYHDQGAVRAALNGRVLILDGVEHAERNVLPILNNLLENREMHLESGKFLMSPERYDKLLGGGLSRISGS